VADKMFSDTYVPVGDNRPYTVLVSIVAHSLIIVAAIMVPVMASDVVMPQKYALITFREAPPLPPPMPPPSNAPRPSAPDVQPSIPVVAPDGIRKEEPIESASAPGDGVNQNAGFVPGVVDGLLDLTAPPPPTVDRAPVVPVGGVVQRPMKVRDAAPMYPAIARAARVQGIVIIEATIGVNGNVQDARILRSIPLLDAAALDAVRQWQYTPTRLNGMPVAVVMTVTVNFKLQ
jgi:periplasmic protein TonB